MDDGRRGRFQPGRRRLTTPAASVTITMEEIEAAANARGLTLESRRFGPAFKMIARRLRRDEGEADGGGAGGLASERTDDADADEDIVATHEGFFAPPPFGILHMDSMRVYNSRVTTAEKDTMRSTFGIAILLGTMSLLAASEMGCKKCELLAIDDGNEYAAKLVKYYSRLGFETVRVVGDNGLRDLPDLLVWGGVGTRMNARVDDLLEKWGNVLRKSLL